jgi:hypothetical protein
MITQNQFQMAGLCLLLNLLWLAQPATCQEILEAGPLQFEMHIIDEAFRSEGVAVADVENDGDMDIMVGDYWYEAPNWTMHEIREPGAYVETDYCEAFLCWSDDYNNDGYPDLLVMPYGGKQVRWYENPQGGYGRWPVHAVGFTYFNEQPMYVDLMGTGGRQLVSATDDIKFSYFSPGADPTAPWPEGEISGTGAPMANIWDHGLGAGDVNGDGRTDVITQKGWYEQPPEGSSGEWNLRQSQFNNISQDQPANIYTYDVNDDGLSDIITAAAHNYGVWWYEQLPGNEWQTHIIDEAVSSTHSIMHEDMDDDGLPDIITGKRWYGHNGLDPGGNDAAILMWFKFSRPNGVPTYEKYVIHTDGGVGINWQIGDFNGDGHKDICISNKKGVRMYYRYGAPAKTQKPSFTGENRFNFITRALPEHLEVTFDARGSYELKVASLDGRNLYSYRGTGSGLQSHKIKSLKAGIYTLSLNNMGHKSAKLVKR